MSQKLPSGEQQEELSWEETVAGYLQENPDFFERHQEALTKLTIPHQESGRAVSLIERQVQGMRKKNENLGQQLHDLVSIARENDSLSERLHRFALAMIESASLAEVLENARSQLREEFRLDSVNLLFNHPIADAKDYAEFAWVGDSRLVALLEPFSGKRRQTRPVCGANQDEATLAFLFGEEAAKGIQSCALVPLGSGPDGLLVLGSQAADRFRPHMGTVYLSKLGELLYRAAARYFA